MTNETFSDRLKLAMQAKQFKQVDLIRAAQRRGVKLGKSHVSQYVSGKTVPAAIACGIYILVMFVYTQVRYPYVKAKQEKKEDK